MKVRALIVWATARSRTKHEKANGTRDIDGCPSGVDASSVGSQLLMRPERYPGPGLELELRHGHCDKFGRRFCHRRLRHFIVARKVFSLNVSSHTSRTPKPLHRHGGESCILPPTLRRANVRCRHHIPNTNVRCKRCRRPPQPSPSSSVPPC